MLNDFEQLVLNMRQAQREYFHTRSPEGLNRAKQLERQVDNLLTAKQNQDKPDQTLFDLCNIDKYRIQK